MQAADAFWHVTNFFAPALFMGAAAGVATRWIWRREVAGVGVLRLWAWASGAAALVSVAGLVVFGHDGRMATYAAMVVASAFALWWVAFRSGSRR